MKTRIAQAASLVMFFLFIATVPSYAQTEEWRVTYDTSTGTPANLHPAADRGQQIGFDAAGNVYVVVASSHMDDVGLDNPIQYIIFKYDAYGDEQWHVGGFYGSFADFHVDPQGNVYGAFSNYYYYYYSPTNYGGDKNDANIFKINSDGSMAWWISWNNSAVNENDYAIAIDVDTVGNV